MVSVVEGVFEGVFESLLFENGVEVEELPVDIKFKLGSLKRSIFYGPNWTLDWTEHLGPEERERWTPRLHFCARPKKCSADIVSCRGSAERIWMRLREFVPLKLRGKLGERALKTC